jgi:hypothetical protein
MKKLLALVALMTCAYAQQVTISDTLTNSVGGAAFTGRITVTLNSPGSAQPLYYATTSIAGWQYVLCVGTTGSDCSATTAAGVVTLSLYANSTITPAGTSYSARFAPAKGSPWSETWVVTASSTTLYQVRSTTVPTPTTMFSVGQLSGGSATSGQCLAWSGSAWAPTTCGSGGGGISDPGSNGMLSRTALNTTVARTITGTANQITVTNGDGVSGAPTLSFPTNMTLPGTTTGTFSGNLTGNVTGNVSGTSGSTTGNAATATALAANGTNCSAGAYPKGVDASGAAESCTAVSLTADVSGILPVANGGTNNAFFAVSGPATSAKTYTFPNSSATVLTSAAAVTIGQGGTGTGLTLTGLVRGSASAMTAAELSGDATTSGSNAVTVTRLNGVSLAGLSTGLLKNTTTTGAPSIAVAADVYALWSGTCSASTFLRGDGACATPAGGGSGLTSLNLQTGSTQTFANDTNVTITSATDTHTLGWSGTLAVSRGGTGLGSGTSGGVLAFTASGTLASSGALTAGALVLGGGAGAAPTVLANSSSPNAGEYWIGQQAPNASATRCLVCVGATAWAGGNANGTAFGINVATGFAGHLIRGATNSTTMFSVDGTGDTRAISFQAVNSGFSLLSTGLSHLSNTAVGYSNTSSGSSAGLRITGSAGTAATNFFAIRNSSGGTPTDQIRMNADSKALMVGQTVNTTSLSSVSQYLGDRTATTGVTRQVLEAGAGQSTTSILEVYLNNATAMGGSKVYEIEPDGSFRSTPTASKPTCASGIRGTYWYFSGGTGVKDTVEVCAKDVADAYAWRTIY